MYVPFKNFVFRTPTLPVNAFFQEMSKLEKEEIYWKQFLQDTLLQEAIFLASPVLDDEIGKYLSGYLTKEKDIEKLKCAVLRYFSRMTSRCTPFGLFAGFSLGEFCDDYDGRGAKFCAPTGQITLPLISNYQRYTRLDMHYLCALAQEIGKNEAVQRNVKYYPNSSLYALGDKLRYVEYFYKNTRRVHQISSVDFSEYLEKILASAQQGAAFKALASLVIQMLPEENISMEEAEGFITELISNQILVSDLEPEITGKDFLIQLLKYGRGAKFCAPTTHLAALLKKMDEQSPGSSINLYKEAEEVVKTTETAYEKNLLFQVDMFKPIENATLNNKIADEVLEAITLMNRITFAPRETALKKFADNFYERYEEREMPLLKVLDVESGIGYPANKGDISPLLEGYTFPDKESTQNTIEFNRVQSILHKKLINSYKENNHSVEFTEQDFEFLKPNWDDLPQTISCMCEIFHTSNRKPHTSNLAPHTIFVHSAGGSSAANILGRFCHVDQALEEYVKEITTFESSQNPDKIYAEIVHLPESRLGNILLRPVLREYEIPYLAKSSVPVDYQILLSDLFISVRQGKIILRSKKLNKEIVPRLSTAHNYSMNAMPVYHFLCDLQTQGLRRGVGFSWGSLSGEFDFLPRAVYKNTILALATWKVKTNDFKKLIEKQNDTEIKSNIQLWRKEKNIPQLALLTEGDNELLIDFENVLSVKMLYSAIKKKEIFELKEFLFDMQNAIVNDDMGNTFTNEFIITFYKKQADE
ncbi:MAG: lantibiotic dehydratase family protein [Bacteroidetes bacterium]|nr:lantibiotic dehydratase family protein [Bacteroidota bacterium]MCL2303630.1 lantibiotic dehydratase family protein [Lentimicrobiaceae bacterium]